MNGRVLQGSYEPLYDGFELIRMKEKISIGRETHGDNAVKKLGTMPICSLTNDERNENRLTFIYSSNSGWMNGWMDGWMDDG